MQAMWFACKEVWTQHMNQSTPPAATCMHLFARDKRSRKRQEVAAPRAAAADPLIDLSVRGVGESASEREREKVESKANDCNQESCAAGKELRSACLQQRLCSCFPRAYSRIACLQREQRSSSSSGGCSSPLACNQRLNVLQLKARQHESRDAAACDKRQGKHGLSMRDKKR